MHPTKNEMWHNGIAHAVKFCETNGFSVPEFVSQDVKDWPFGTCAYYRMTPDGKGKVVCCVKKTAHVGVAAMAWSFPGYIADRTPYGVVAHEIGHHVDAIKGGCKRGFYSGFSSDIRKTSGEKRITSYCPNDAEWFAEMMRLFITNPALLQAIRPKTYAMLIAKGLTPIEKRNFQQVLELAPERTLQQAIKRVLRGE